MSATATMPVYLDCDTGIDDALALAYLLAHPAIDLVGIGTVSGNISAAQAAANTRGLLAVAGADEVPVAVGSQDFLTASFHGGAPLVHGEDGIGGVAAELPDVAAGEHHETAVELLLRLSHEYRGSLRVLAIGPLTNLARALLEDPGLPMRVHSVTLMAGAVEVPGNVSPLAEANVHNDAAAAAEVFAAGWAVVFAPLDVTMSHTFDETHRDRLLHAPGTLPRLLGQMLDQYFAFYTPRYGARRCALHDPLAAALITGDITGADVRRGSFTVVADGGDEHGRVVEHLGAGFEPSASAVLATDDPVAEILLGSIERHTWPVHA